MNRIDPDEWLVLIKDSLECKYWLIQFHSKAQ